MDVAAAKVVAISMQVHRVPGHTLTYLTSCATTSIMNDGILNLP